MIRKIKRFILLQNGHSVLETIRIPLEVWWYFLLNVSRRCSILFLGVTGCPYKRENWKTNTLPSLFRISIVLPNSNGHKTYVIFKWLFFFFILQNDAFYVSDSLLQKISEQEQLNLFYSQKLQVKQFAIKTTNWNKGIESLPQLQPNAIDLRNLKLRILLN